MTAATMADVARLAGVSKQTVSRVINDHPSVSDRTRAAVELAIANLDYRPNAVARQLATRDALNVGVVCANLTLFGPAQIVQGIETAARARGYHTTISGMSSTDADGADDLDHFFGQTFDALILVDVDEQLHLEGRRTPRAGHVVSAPLGSDSEGVWNDHRAAVQEATEHLIGLGHRRIAHVSGPRQWPSAREREQGWRHALDAAGLPAGPLLSSDWSARSGYEAGVRLRDDPGVTAVVAANDNVALGLVSAFCDAGLDVPGDISVVGYDDNPDSTYFRPPLTTVACDFRTMGARYIEALDLRLGGAPAHPTPPLTHLVVRSSTASPPER
ncbi:MAG TPA: LacI family DNA-binding transcriptional regulator [Cellulomonas sp.]